MPKLHSHAAQVGRGFWQCMLCEPCRMRVSSLLQGKCKRLRDTANATSSSGNNKSAVDTTVNAAFLAGIVKTTASSYSGGVENFPRFLENWSAKTFTYNGSMVVMFYSKIAKGLWNNGTSYYTPPTRNWAFDNNFLNPLKTPPGTPSFRYLNRGDWLVLGRDPSA